MYKRVYTLNFERGTAIDTGLLSKLQNARASGSIVVSTPSAVKSVMLKHLENILVVNDPGEKDRKELQREVRTAPRLLKLWREGVCLIDEVDVVLHPLKSELNFPIGRKEDLDFAPLRWHLPMHIVDAVLAVSQGVPAVS